MRKCLSSGNVCALGTADEAPCVQGTKKEGLLPGPYRSSRPSTCKPALATVLALSTPEFAAVFAQPSGDILPKLVPRSASFSEDLSRSVRQRVVTKGLPAALPTAGHQQTDLCTGALRGVAKGASPQPCPGHSQLPQQAAAHPPAQPCSPSATDSATTAAPDCARWRQQTGHQPSRSSESMDSDPESEGIEFSSRGSVTSMSTSNRSSAEHVRVDDDAAHFSSLTTIDTAAAAAAVAAQEQDGSGTLQRSGNMASAEPARKSLQQDMTFAQRMEMSERILRASGGTLHLDEDFCADSAAGGGIHFAEAPQVPAAQQRLSSDRRLSHQSDSSAKDSARDSTDSQRDRDSQDGNELAGLPVSARRNSQGLSEGQAAVELFFRLNHARQTVDYVKRQAALFSQLDKAHMSVWSALDLLNTLREYEAAMLNDDEELEPDMPLLEHALQTAEACRVNYPDAEWLHVAGLLHGLGKLLAHKDIGAQPQWSVCGESFPVGCRFSSNIVGHQFFSVNPDRRRRVYNSATGMYRQGCGLQAVYMSWSAAEYLYMVLVLNKTRLPAEALFVLRHQKLLAVNRPGGAYQELLNDYDRSMLPWLKRFQDLAVYKRRPVEGALTGPALRQYYDALLVKYGLDGKLKW